MSATPLTRAHRLQSALPFWCAYLLPLALWAAASYGGWFIALLPMVIWYGFAGLDMIIAPNTDNLDPNSPEADLRLYQYGVMLWAPLQCAVLLALLWYIPRAAHLTTLEKIGVFLNVGLISGTVGINYSHELLHQKNRIERWLGDLLLAMVMYSHFRSEHLLVHHRHVGTPRDAVSARYNEGFHRFYPRVLLECPRSAFRAEAEMLARRNLPWFHRSNPFWRYGALQAGMLILAALLGGWSGLALFFVQSGVAVWQLELVNYVEHYGLPRQQRADGKYEPVKPHHSWNAAHRASGWLLINLQRHSDHHYKPDRRFPVLQHHDEATAPQLPYSYPLMTAIAMVPPLWRRMMNPRVRAWRKQHYPQITDWSAYKFGAR